MAADLSLGSTTVDVTGGQLVIHDDVVNATKGIVSAGNLTISAAGDITTNGTITPKLLKTTTVQTNELDANIAFLPQIHSQSLSMEVANWTTQQMMQPYYSVVIGNTEITLLTWQNMPQVVAGNVTMPNPVVIGAPVQVFATLASLTKQIADLTTQVAALKAKVGL